MKPILTFAAAFALMTAPAFAQTDTESLEGTGAAEGFNPAAAAGAPAAETGQTVPASALTAEQFVNTATVSNTFEIETSRLALEAAESEDVRAFAQRMIDDHTAATGQLSQAAEADGVEMPAPYLDARHQEMVAQLGAAQGEAFDTLYLQMQRQAHIDSIALFGAYAGREGNLGVFAAQTLPVLEMHHAMLEELEQPS